MKKHRKSASYHHGNLREALIASGLELIEERGARGLTLREVARRAGVSHAAPYRHFADREGLLAAVAAEGFAGFDDALAAAAAEHPGDPAAAFGAMGVAYVRYAARHPSHYQVMFGGAVPDFSRYPELKEVAGRTFGRLVGAIEAGQRAGAIRAGDPRELAIAAWSLTHGLASLAIAGLVDPAGDIDGLSRRVTAVLAAGLSPGS